MIQPIIRIEIYKKQISSVNSERVYYKSTPDYIFPEASNILNLRATSGIEKRKDSISFSLQNFKELQDNGTFTYTLVDDAPALDTKDLIKVYAWNMGDLPDIWENLSVNEKTNFHIMTAYVKSWDYDSTETEGIFNITSFNRTEVLLNSFMFAPYNEGEKVPNMIVDSMNKIKNYNANDGVIAYLDYAPGGIPGERGAYNIDGSRVYYTLDEDGNKIFNTNGVGTPETGYIRTYKKDAYNTDGTIKTDYESSVPSSLWFDDVIFVETYKPFMEHLEELSKSSNTGDDSAGMYVSFVDQYNYLHWVPKDFNLNNYLYEFDHTSISVNKDVDDVVNAVIVNAGTDPDHNGVLSLAFNSSSMGLNGARWKYKGKTDIIEEIYRKERESGDRTVQGNFIEGTGNQGNFIESDSYPDSYPWVIQTSGNDPFDNFNYVANSTEIYSDDEYKDYIRDVGKLQGEEKGNNIIKYSGKARLKCRWELENGTNQFNSNDMIEINIPSLGISDDNIINLRIMAITHSFSNDWKTTLELEEDIDYNLSSGD